MSDGARRLRDAFPAHRPALAPYLMGGYPDPDASLAALRAVAEHADLIELGIPFSDPLADGPTIQAAGQRALDAGVRPGDVLRIAEQLQDGPPVVLMTYVNLLLRVGPRVFFERAARAGVAGMIIPDLPIDEGHELRDAARRAGVAMVAMAAPTTTDARLAAIGRQAEGFTYLVSVAGVTGGVVSVDDELRGFVERARRVIDTPLVVGFGIRTPEHAAAVGAFADGIAVGAEFIRAVERPDGPVAAGRLAAGLANALAACRPGDVNARK
ncbi:MAG: tryptophan synthase subunit alpha [Thermoleophilia bacterium]